MEAEEHKEFYPVHTNNLYPRFSDAVELRRQDNAFFYRASEEAGS